MTKNASTVTVADQEDDGVQPVRGVEPARGTSILAGRGTFLFTRFGVIWGLIALVVVAQWLYPDFLSGSNLRVILIGNIAVGLAAVGMTFLMLSGAFDLSAGPTLAFGAVFYTSMSNSMSLWAAAGLTVLLGVVIGTMNGLIVTKLGVNAFVATLGTSSVVAGCAFLFTGSEPVTSTNESFADLGTESVFGVPVCAFMLLAFVLVSALVLPLTKFGRSIYSIGGNPEASRLCGIHVDFVRISCYVLVSVCSVVGGMVLASQLQTVQANVGANYSLTAVAIVVIGGTSLLGGEGAMWRTAVGVLIVGGISNLLDARAVDSNWQSIVTGIVLISAVALDVLGTRLEARRASSIATTAPATS